MINCLNNSVNNNFNKDIARQGQSQNRDNFLPVLMPGWIRDARSYYSHWTRSAEAAIINVLAGYANHHHTVYPTQSTIAMRSGLSREHVNRVISRLESMGMIAKQWRAYTSCIYKLHPIFNDVNFRGSLKDLMPNLRWLPLLLLVGISLGIHPQFKPATPGFITLSINSYPLYIKKLLAIAIKKYNNQYQVDHRVVTRDGKTHITLYPKDMKQKIMESVAMTQPIFTETVIAAAEFLKLSMAGKCNLSAYDDKVIAIAMQRLKSYGKEVQKPFNMLMKLCNEISHEMGMNIDRARAYQVATQFSITLGVDDNILAGCDNPLKPGSYKRGVSKSTSPQHKQFAAKSARSYSSNTNTRPTQQSSNGEWNLTKLQELNEGIDLSLASFVGNKTLYVPTPNHDSTHRRTTQAERDIWNESRRLLMESEKGKAAAAMGLVMPEAPMWFNGDCNVPASRNFIIQPDGTLILPGMTPEQTRLITAPFLRPLTEKEVEHAAWLATYISESQKPAPSWYTSLLVDIKKRGDNLEKKLELYREALENERAQALKSSAKDS
jgi:hypothetical protein